MKRRSGITTADLPMREGTYLLVVSFVVLSVHLSAVLHRSAQPRLTSVSSAGVDPPCHLSPVRSSVDLGLGLCLSPCLMIAEASERKLQSLRRLSAGSRGAGARQTCNRRTGKCKEIKVNFGHLLRVVANAQRASNSSDCQSVQVAIRSATVARSWRQTWPAALGLA